jgi:spermidine/putrescine transport system ATP-binding protein
MLQINKLFKRFNTTTACNSIDLTVNEGEFFFILGPSGCGKSTLLKIIAGLLKQDAGNIELDGTLYNEIPAYERPFNMVFQNYSLFPHLTVFDNVGFSLKMKNVGKEEIKIRVNETLKLFQISDLSNKKPENLSGGQQQRVALARAIINHPKVLLLDEPLSALDEKLRLEMQETLKELKSKINTTFIYVTHNQDEALSMGDRIAIMKDGNIEQIGTPKEIYYFPKTKYIAEFMGELNIVKYIVHYVENGNERFIHYENETIFLNYVPIGLVKKVVQIVRPEDIIINKNPLQKGVLEVIKKGSVIQTLFKGNTMSYIIHCVDGTTIKATNFNTGFSEDILVGEEVYFGWKNDAIKNVEL